MNILMVSPTIPSPSAGASTRNFQLLRVLAQHHEVSLLALGEQDDQLQNGASLNDLAHSVQIITYPPSSSKRWRQAIDLMRGKPYVLNAHLLPEMQRAIDVSFASNRYDAVLFESMFMAGYHLSRKVKIILDQHNIEYELRMRTYEQETSWIRKWYNRLEGRALKPIEIERCESADAVLVTSERERLTLRKQLPASQIMVVPNGVDSAMFTRDEAVQRIAGRIVFTGSMEYYPNVHAVRYFAETCWPSIRARLSHATWYIVGKNPLPEVQQLAELPGVTVTGSVPDVRPYLAEASVAIVPLLIGSGTRLKILEAMSMRCPVVSTSRGCEGLEVMAGEHLMVADEPEAFAQAVITLMNDPGLRTTFENNGRALVEDRYSWEQCGSPLVSVLDAWK